MTKFHELPEQPTYIGKFVTNISQELLEVGFCNLGQVL